MCGSVLTVRMLGLVVRGVARRVQVAHHGGEAVPLAPQLQLELRHHLHLHARLRGRAVVQRVGRFQVPAEWGGV